MEESTSTASDQVEELIAGADHEGLDDYAFEGDECIPIDWCEQEDSIVEYVAAYIPDDALTFDWDENEEDILLSFKGNEMPAGLTISPVDRSVMLCALNRIMRGRYEIRAFASTIGTSDTMGVLVRPQEWWDRMDGQYTEQMEQTFVRFVEGVDMFAAGINADTVRAAKSQPWDAAVAAAKKAQEESNARRTKSSTSTPPAPAAESSSHSLSEPSGNADAPKSDKKWWEFWKS